MRWAEESEVATLLVECETLRSSAPLWSYLQRVVGENGGALRWCTRTEEVRRYVTRWEASKWEGGTDLSTLPVWQDGRREQRTPEGGADDGVKFDWCWRMGEALGERDIQEVRQWVLGDARAPRSSSNKTGGTFYFPHSYTAIEGYLLDDAQQRRREGYVSLEPNYNRAHKVMRWQLRAVNYGGAEPQLNSMGSGGLSIAVPGAAITGCSVVGLVNAAKALNVMAPGEGTSALHWFINEHLRLMEGGVRKGAAAVGDEPSESRARSVATTLATADTTARKTAIDTRVMLDARYSTLVAEAEVLREAVEWLSKATDKPGQPLREAMEEGMRQGLVRRYGMYMDAGGRPKILIEPKPATWVLPTGLVHEGVEKRPGIWHQSPYWLDASAMVAGGLPLVWRAHWPKQAALHTHIGADGVPCVGHSDAEKDRVKRYLLATWHSEPLEWLKFWMNFMATANFTGGYLHPLFKDNEATWEELPSELQVDGPPEQPTPDGPDEDDENDEHPEDEFDEFDEAAVR